MDRETESQGGEGPEITEQLGGRARTRNKGNGLLPDLRGGFKSDGNHE